MTGLGYKKNSEQEVSGGAKVQVTGHRSQVRSQVTGHRSGYRSQVTGHRSGHRSPKKQ